MATNCHMSSVGLAIALSGAAHAGIVDFNDKAEWEAAAGEFTTIGFSEFPDGTTLDEHYADLGIHFTGVNFVESAQSLFPNDGWGLANDFGSGIRFNFDSPRQALAVDYPGGITFRLMVGEEIIYDFEFLSAGTGNFAGVISSTPFDSFILYDGDPTVLIDDLHFGPAVPAPMTAALFVFLPAIGRRRRRQDVLRLLGVWRVPCV